MRRLCFVIPLTIGLAACAGSSAFPPTSPYYRIPAGSRVIVKQSLPIPANRSRAWIQYGKVIHKKERDQYYPHCWFLSHKRSDSPREIKPDTFTVVETRKLEEYVADQRSFRLAASRHLGGLFAQDGATAIEYITEIRITSSRQPDIAVLSCSQWSDPSDAQHMTLLEINQVLGELAVIEPAEASTAP